MSFFYRSLSVNLKKKILIVLKYYLTTIKKTRINSSVQICTQHLRQPHRYRFAAASSQPRRRHRFRRVVFAKICIVHQQSVNTSHT